MKRLWNQVRCPDRFAELTVHVPRLPDRPFLIQPIQASDKDAFVRHLSRPEIHRQAAPAIPGEEIGKVFDAEFGAMKTLPPRGHAVKIVDPQSGQSIGYIHVFFDPHDLKEGGWLSYTLQPELWGNGLMGPAVETFIAEASRKYGIHQWNTIVFDGNPASERILKRLGFKETFRMPAKDYHPNWKDLDREAIGYSRSGNF